MFLSNSENELPSAHRLNAQYQKVHDKDYDEIVDSCCEAWNTFCDEDGNIQNLCTRFWAKS